MNEFEVRTAGLAVSDNALTGYAVRWNSPSALLFGKFYETFAPGAFSESLSAGADVRALYEHDAARLLGRTASGSLVLHEDDTGLRFELTPPETQLGQDVLALVRRGDITGMSFGFRTVLDDWQIDETPYKRTVFKAELNEITVTATPAYPESGIEIARRSLMARYPLSATPDALRRRRAALMGV